MWTKRPLLLSIVFLFLSPAVWADSVAFQNTGGRITTSGAVLTLNGSILTVVNNSSAGNFGSVSLTTGALISGSLATGGRFGAGGSVVVTGNGTNGLSAGVVFKGSFSGATAWTAIWVPTAGPNHQGAWYYTLSGPVRGMLSNGQPVFGSITQSSFDVPKGQEFSSFVNVDSGTLNISVPEPGSLGTLATGLASITGLLGRRRRT